MKLLPLRRRPSPARVRRRQPRLHVEQLEARLLLYAADLLAANPFDPGHILVGDAAGQVQKVELPAGTTVAEALETYAAGTGVAFAEPDYIVQAAVLPSDSSFGSLYGLNNTGQVIGGVAGVVDADIDAPEAWDLSQGSSEVVVGVIDTGVDYNHPDLYLNIWINQEEIPAAIRGSLLDTDGDGLITFYDLNHSDNQGPGKIADLNANGRIDGSDLLNNASGWEDGIDQDPYLVGVSTVSRVDDLIGWNFVSNNNNPLDDNNHGTHVAGTIGAIGNNGVGVSGVNWQVLIAGLKFLNSSGSGAISAAQAALDYATSNGIKITNNSWGGGGFSSSFSAALNRANAAGAVFVAAAGNSGINIDATPSYPASYTQSNVIAVAASDNRDRLASFSNYGATSVDLAAPGVSVRSTVPGGGYASFSGTSMATPHVAGAAALVWAAHPEWTSSQVITSILSTADVVSGLVGRVATGRLNVNDAVRTEFGPPPPDTTGPRVTAAAANSSTSASSVRLTFSEAIDPQTFDLADVTSFLGPAGNIEALAIAPVAGSAGTQFDLTFATQSAAGTYSFVVGPDISDAAGNAMDQSGDGASGGADDAYQGSFTLTSALTFTNSTRAAIRDRVNTYSYLAINQNVSIADLNVRLNITHTYDSDLFIELRHPSGLTVLLVNRRGGSGNNFLDTILDDEAATAIAAGTAPFAGSFRPESALSAFDGRSALGTWRLRVYDAAYQDIGTLNSWSLIVTPAASGAAAKDFRVWALAPQTRSVSDFVFAVSRPVTRSLSFANAENNDAADHFGLRAPERLLPSATSAGPMRLAAVSLHQPSSTTAASDALFAEIGAGRLLDDLVGRRE
ncbi:MAG: S8 family serine peptidase [Planctomycetaceae bacterium]|nr:S8 family serine peptidase [Planctomycetaceae bacterium]